ncbi:MAG: helix-turn-helix domain-containing protein [Vicinamibacteria bacterium]
MGEEVRVWRAPGWDGLELHRGTTVTRDVPRHCHEEYQLCLVERGAGELFYRGAFHPNPSSSLFVVHPGEVHSNRATAAEGCTYRVVNADPEVFRRVWSDIAARDRDLPFFPAAVLLEADVLAPFRRFHILSGRPGLQLARDDALVETLAVLLRYAEGGRESARSARAEPSTVRRARDYLEAHFAESVSLALLSGVAGLSSFHLNRAFRLAYGLPPHAFQTQLRVARARKLLREGLPPAAAAAETGFTDQSHLHRHFKRVVGVTPAVFRKNVQDDRSGER